MKYRLTDETKELCGKTLFRIEAIRDIPKYGIQKGDRGGWIESERNLSQENECWVYGNAKVYGDAWVSGNAKIRRNGKIESIKDYCVFGPFGIRDDFTTFYKTETGIWVSCGCFNGSIEKFLDKVEETHGDNKHGRIYKALAELASMKLGGGETMGAVIELSTLHAILCVADLDRAKQFKRMRKVNMKARKKKLPARQRRQLKKMYNFASLL